jgi:hypothetical protein
MWCFLPIPHKVVVLHTDSKFSTKHLPQHYTQKHQFLTPNLTKKQQQNPHPKTPNGKNSKITSVSLLKSTSPQKPPKTSGNHQHFPSKNHNLTHTKITPHKTKKHIQQNTNQNSISQNH